MEYHRSYAAVAYGLGALLLGALCLVSPGDAWAEDTVSEDGVSQDAAFEDAASEDGVTLHLTKSRVYALPEGFEHNVMRITTTPDGRVFYTQNTGITQAATGGVTDAACTIVAVDDTGARAISYRFQDEPTGCISVLAHPDGGFFLRGNRLTIRNHQAAPADEGGFIARLDADYREVWARSDRSFIYAREVSEGGPGAFQGRYLGALGNMSYHPELNRLLLFSSSNFSAADSRTVTQAHVVDADTGELRVNGLSFGAQGMRSQLSTVSYRALTQDFLLRFNDANNESDYFTYNGRRQIDTYLPVVPVGKDWSQRRIIQSAWSSQRQQLFVLSKPRSGNEQTHELSVFDAQGNMLWEVELGQSVGEVSLGMADRLWILQDYIVVGYRQGSGEYMRVLAHQTGETLGVDEFGMDAILGESTFRIELIYIGALGQLYLLRTEGRSKHMHEDRVDIIRSSAGPGDADAGPDAGDVGMPPGGGDGGCAVSDSGAIPPFSALSLAFGLLVFTIADRRRMNRIDRGDLGNDRV